MKNYYDILELPVTASVDQIKKSFRQKAIKYHPDKHFGDKYFTDKFIDVKEAYDILSDETKRAEYDKQYKENFATETENQKQETYKEQKRNEKEKEEQFFYDPYKPFYSYQDRLTNDTPQFNPKINHWGEPLPGNIEFFQLPKNIGKIVSGYSTLTKDMQPSTGKQTTLRYLRLIGIALAISAALIFGFAVQNPVWIVIWAVAPFVIAVWLASKASEFKHTSTFIGVNGFAEFKCEDTQNNITSSFEINFKDITDLLRMTQVRNHNFSYANTAFSFVWLNRENIVREVNDLHYSKEGNPEKNHTTYWLNDFAERYWTVYLLDNMEKDLETKGYIEFNLYVSKNDKLIRTPYIQLGIGYIKFLSAKGDTIYNFNEIKKVYTKGSNLFIEHNNYEKKFFFFESGNKNGIPLMNLSNRQFFFRAMNLLLGYKFS